MLKIRLGYIQLLSQTQLKSRLPKTKVERINELSKMFHTNLPPNNQKVPYNIIPKAKKLSNKHILTNFLLHQHLLSYYCKQNKPKQYNAYIINHMSSYTN